MSKIITKSDPLSQSKSIQKKATTRVTLVIEHYLDTDEPHTLTELTRLLDPETTEISLIHAMSDILTSLPFASSDPAQVGNSIRQRERQHEQYKEQMRNSLEVSKYTIVNEQKCNMLDECANQILQNTRENKQDLLIVCSSHQPNNTFTRSHFSMHLATHADVPVLILRQTFVKDRKALKILFGVDGSDASLAVARKLPDLLRTEALEVILATVQTPIYQNNADQAPFINPELLDEVFKSNANMIFEMVRGVLENQGIAVSETKMLMGSPATELGQLAQLENPDLLLVGSHNKKGFLAWLTGSVSSQLLHWDTHNILVVR